LATIIRFSDIFLSLFHCVHLLPGVQQQRRAAGRERERKRMDEARAARSQMARRAIMTTPDNANQNMQQQTKRTRSEHQTAKRVTRARK
jgi:hypothetical protein